MKKVTRTVTLQRHIVLMAKAPVELTVEVGDDAGEEEILEALDNAACQQRHDATFGSEDITDSLYVTEEWLEHKERSVILIAP